MTNETGGTYWRGARVLIAGAVALIMSSGGVVWADDDSDSDSDGDREKITISGNSTISESCGLPGADFALDMTGDLDGCLSIFAKSFDCDELNGFAKYTERGKEVFVGTIDGVGSGEFKTKYVVEGIYAQGFCESFDFASQLAGGCDHKVKGQKGDLRDLRGLIKFYDVVVGIPAGGIGMPGTDGASNFFYEGDLEIDD